MKPFSCVVAAACKSRGIGFQGGLPWHLPAEMAHFKKLTSSSRHPAKQNAVIMGRKTWNSIPEKFRPLPHRINIILTSRGEKLRAEVASMENVRIAPSLEAAMNMVSSPSSPLSERVSEVFVIGGARLFEEAFRSPRCETIYLTRVYTDAPCDAFMPPIDTAVWEDVEVSERHRDNGIEFEFVVYRRRSSQREQPPNSDASVKRQRTHNGSVAAVENGEEKEASAVPENAEEQQYLDLVRHIIEHGVVKSDRTGTGTLSTFGCQMRFNLRDNRFPLLTTKRVFWRGVAEELLWLISGNTNAKVLHDKNIKIWDGNASRTYLDSIGQGHREEGDLGPVYGFQWRHFGAKYTDMHADYTGHGIDQLAKVIQTIKTNPNDRRIILTAWNPADLDQMALPPCHMFCQFYVANGELSCQMYQRSCDMGLGVPFNIASYALLTRLIAQVCDLKAGDLIHTLGDAHVYINHIDALRMQLARVPREFPQLEIDPSVKNIDDFRFEHLKLKNYNPHESIGMQMAV